MADDETKKLVKTLNRLSTGALAALLPAFADDALEAVLACDCPKAEPHVVTAVNAEIQRRVELRSGNNPPPEVYPPDTGGRSTPKPWKR